MTDLELEVIFNKHSWAALGAISPSKDFCLSAMKEAVEKGSIGFLEWVRDNCYIGEDGTWRYRNDKSIQIFTNEYLYEQYLKSLK